MKRQLENINHRHTNVCQERDRLRQELNSNYQQEGLKERDNTIERLKTENKILHTAFNQKTKENDKLQKKNKEITQQTNELSKTIEDYHNAESYRTTDYRLMFSGAIIVLSQHMVQTFILSQIEPLIKSLQETFLEYWGV